MPQWQHPNSFGTYDGGPGQVYTCNSQRKAQVAIPDIWKQAWQKHYKAMWGAQPWMPSGPLAHSPEFGGDSGNVFNSGRAAMALTQMWYLCCLNDFIKAGHEFQVGIIPMSADGVVHGQVDVETFRIWKGARDPEEAFQTLAYLITSGGDKLLPAYGMLPAIASKTDDFFAQLSQKYPFVTPESWEVFKASTAYPDSPSAEGTMPNFSESYDRIAAFGELMDKTSPPAFDFEAQFQKLEDDLTVIFKDGRC